ncbi:MAG: hypothetical protein ACYTDU_09545 [Planctomycetota bacterium]|jgi:hypothetical protein
MRILPVALLFSILASCGGGGPGSDKPPGPPGPAFAETTSTGLAIATAFDKTAAIGALVLTPVSETEMGADLNGDGDQADRVLQQVDTAGQVNFNLGVATTGPVLASDRHFAFLVVEAAQGGADFNGDGDASDAVWFVYDPNRPPGPVNPFNTLLATPPNGLVGAATTGGFVLLQSEGSAGVDLNGDGDVLDTIPTAFDGGLFVVSTAVIPPHAAGTPLVARAGRVLVAAAEQAATADLNGDGDQIDTTLGYVDFTVGLAVFRPVGNTFARAIANHPYALTDGAAVYFIDEASDNGIDLNNDGDATDAIVAVNGIAAGTQERLPFNPAIPSLALAGATSVGIGAGPNRAIVAIDEAGQGNLDLNNDFDTVDYILAWINTSGAPGTMNITAPPYTLAPQTPVIDGVRGVVAVSEPAMTFFGIDLNADGDTTDAVAYLLDTSATPGLMINLSLAVATMAMNGNDAMIGVFEPFQGGADLNGNSVVSDVVQFYFDLGDQPHTMRGLGIVSNRLTFFRTATDELRIGALLGEGQSPNFDDLNGDGDVLDTGLDLIHLDVTRNPPTIIVPTPYFAGTAAAGMAPPIAIGDDVFVFPSQEAARNTDLNGDGDMADTVLCCTRILPK